MSFHGSSAVLAASRGSSIHSGCIRHNPLSPEQSGSCQSSPSLASVSTGLATPPLTRQKRLNRNKHDHDSGRTVCHEKDGLNDDDILPQILRGEITELSLTRAIASLYNDGILPTLCDLLNRLKEPITTRFSRDDLLAAIECCPNLVVSHQDSNSKNSGSIVVSFKETPEGFQGWVDPHDPTDRFDDETWRLFTHFLVDRLRTHSYSYRSPTTTLMPFHFKGGRYGLATEIKHSVAHFRDMRLGEVCHLVQLAINRGILAYEKSVLQPLASCRETVSAQFTATSHERRTNESTGSFSEATREVRASLDLAEYEKKVGMILLEKPRGVIVAQLKRILMQRFRIDIAPERFGARKLLDLLIGMPATCVVFTTDPTSHRLVLLHRRFPIPAGASMIYAPEDIKEPSQFVHSHWETPRYMASISYSFYASRATDEAQQYTNHSCELLSAWGARQLEEMATWAAAPFSAPETVSSCGGLRGQ